MMPRRCSCGRLLGLIVPLLAAALLSSTPAWGHAYLAKSIPARRAVLFAPPQQVQLWFNERLEARFCSLHLHDDRGRSLALGPLQITAEDPKRLSAILPRLAPGVYTVKFRVVSVDGHVVEDRFVFTVRKSGAAE